MPVKVTSVRVGGCEAALTPSPAAKDSDSSQGRAIETPSPRSRVRREMVDADVMCMGCILLEGCCFNRSPGLSVQRYDGLEVRRTCFLPVRTMDFQSVVPVVCLNARRTGSPSYVFFACPVRRTSSPSYNFNRRGNPNGQPASLDVSIVPIVRPECLLFWDSGRCIVQPSKDALHLERCGRSSLLPKAFPLV